MGAEAHYLREFFKKCFWNHGKSFRCTCLKTNEQLAVSIPAHSARHPTSGKSHHSQEAKSISASTATAHRGPAASRDAGTVPRAAGWPRLFKGISCASGFSLVQWRAAKNKRCVKQTRKTDLFNYCQSAFSRFSSDGRSSSAVHINQSLAPRRSVLGPICSICLSFW